MTCQFREGSILGELKERSMLEKFPEATQKCVLSPVFKSAISVAEMSFSISFPLASLWFDPHKVLLALKSPANMNGVGS